MNPIQIGGLAPFTTIDYPGRLAAVLFLRGCPIRCAYCSNPHLLEIGDGEYDPDKIIEWLNARRGKLEAVVFSGGEALMQRDAAIDYMARVRDMGFAIGLHTNGFYPEALECALGVIDWVGLDFKATRAGYPKLTGAAPAYERMMASLDILQRAGTDFEVRITCDPRFVTKSDLLEIADILRARDVKKIALQKYIPHFESDDNKTTAESREQFFNDESIRDKLNGMFISVDWRE
ncbi:MAG: anaerobic ribonucleoside-triphosphate reductase activating protein [Rickettsiales bacterium]|jgi:pyruvate formate lyase activating enzyme|nr:anaerobic ribonucleoside-triphosphate reductase activating protein [Rickettsiales bacterium]